MKLKMFLSTVILLTITAHQAMAEVYTCRLLENFGGDVYSVKIDEKDIATETNISSSGPKPIELIGDENIAFYVLIRSEKNNAQPFNTMSLLAIDKKSQKLLTSTTASLPITYLTALVSNTYAINCFKKAE